MKLGVLSVGCLVWLVVMLAGCGVSVEDMPVDERMRLDADSSEFRGLMEAFPAHIEDLRNNPDELMSDDTDYFMNHLGVPNHRASEEFRNAAGQIIPSLDYVPFPPEFAGILLLIRDDGYEQAREWFNNYESNPEISNRLTQVLEDAKGIAVKGVYYQTYDQLDGGSDALAEKFREYALAELTEFEMPLTEDARENLVLAGMNERSPAVLAHLQAGLPPAGSPLTDPATREMHGPDPMMMEVFVDRARSVRTADGMKELIAFTRENIPQAAPAAPLAIAAFLDRTLAPDAFAMYADIQQNHPDAIEASAEWIEQNPEVSFTQAWQALHAYAGDGAAGSDAVVAWLQEETAEFAETAAEIRKSSPWAGDIASRPVQPSTENREEEYDEGVGQLTAAVAAVDPKFGPALEQAASEATPSAELSDLLLLHVILDHLSQNRPLRGAEIINAKFAAAANFDGPVQRTEMEVATAEEPEATLFLSKSLSKAMAEFVDEEYEQEIAAVYLTLLASQNYDLRSAALRYSQDYFDRDSFVRGLFDYMVRKAQFGLGELALYESALKEFEGIEEPLVQNLDTAIESAGGPENMYWALKVLSLDVFEDIGTETALPVLEMLAQDTSSYDLVNTETNPTTGEETIVSEEEIRFADRANEILGSIQN